MLEWKTLFCYIEFINTVELITTVENKYYLYLTKTNEYLFAAFYSNCNVSEVYM